VKGTPYPPPLLRKSCPQDFVNDLLIKIFLLAAPLQVASATERHRLGAFTVSFSAVEVLDKIPSHWTMYGSNLVLLVVLLAEVTPRAGHENVGGRLGFVFFSEVDPWWDI
jgi:hypothetical protein